MCVLLLIKLRYCLIISSWLKTGILSVQFSHVINDPLKEITYPMRKECQNAKIDTKWKWFLLKLRKDVEHSQLSPWPVLQFLQAKVIPVPVASATRRESVLAEQYSCFQ